MTVLFFTLILCGAELYWRSLGYRPNVDDDVALWAFHRNRIDGEKTVVLVGDSRIQYGFSLRQFRKRFPDHRPIQLAVLGARAYPLLDDLSRDERFNGLVIFGSHPHALSPMKPSTQQEWVDEYHKRQSMGVLERYRALTENIDQLVYFRVRSCLAVTNPQVSPKKMAYLIALGEPLRKPSFIAMNFDRSSDADFKLQTRQQLQNTVLQFVVRRNKATPEDPRPWLQDVAQYEPMVRRIKNRGGHVVFVRFPTSSAHLEGDKRIYPRAQFWDRIAAETGAETIHFLDMPEIANVDCPDMAHLDRRDKARFTDALLDELVGRGLLPRK